MSTDILFCHNCNKTYNVRKEDISLMQKHHKDFNGKEYTKGCFFKELRVIKRAENTKIDNRN